jgi:DNA invertase Pin-like site-specific DNA recombinase
MGTPAPAPIPLITTARPDAAAEPVPVAVLARTSTAELQDPVASLSRQIRGCREWLPPGWYIAGYYWDVESGGLDLEQRGRGEAYKPFAAAGIPRDGGLADLLAEAAAPLPRFAAVVCEDIERSARDTFNALKLEKKLSRQGILLFATDEPASIEGLNSTTVLTRRVKQGVAEWYRLQLKEKAWKGFREHSIAGWNIGPAAYGYLADRVPHPAPGKAAQGRTKSRLVLDPARGPVVTRIFDWRVSYRLSIRTITDRLNADPAAYPPPDGTAWTKTGVLAILANPKYTGHMVFGRTRKQGGTRGHKVPQDQWIWSPEPAHPVLVGRPVWDAAQHVSTGRGNVRDPETPTTQPGRRYLLRSRIQCRICQRRMSGTWRPAPSTGTIYIYYRCPHDPANVRHAAAHPDHPHVSVREDRLMGALAGFFDQYLFGHDRAALLAALLPATATDAAEARARKEARLRAELARIGTAEHGLITELEQPADPADPAAQAYRARIRARYAELYDQRTTTQAQLDGLQQATPQAEDNDPGLLDQLPYAAGLLDDAPGRIKAALLAAFAIHALYNNDDDQVTIRASITHDTPRIIAALLDDPRTDDTTATNPASDTPALATVSQSGQAPIGDVMIHDHAGGVYPG